MKQRVITAIVALLIFIPIIYLGGIWIEICGAALGLVALSEIFIMRKKIIVSADAIVAGIGLLCIILPEKYFSFIPNSFKINQMDLFYVTVLILLIITVFSKNRVTFDDVGVTVLSMLYVGFGFHYFILTREVGDLETLLYILFVIWSTDIGAYMIGRSFGKHKLWPAISPNKTIEGSLGGIICALIVGMVYLQFFPQVYGNVIMAIFTIVFAISGEMGDLVESALKRYYGVKDSGKILPGHGGILDRFDSLIFVFPLLHIFGII